MFYSSSLYDICGYRFGAMLVCQCYGTTFIFVANKVYLINNKKSNQLSLIYCKMRIISILVIIIISNI